MTDTTIIEETFLEDINNLLNSGEIPNLFQEEDKNEIFNNLKDPKTKKAMEGTPEEKWAHFISTSRENLHVALCMSPVGNVLRLRCSKFPSLVNCCTLDWYSSWPDEALISVSYKKMEDLKFPDPTFRKKLSLICKDVHQMATEEAERFYNTMKRKVYTTSKTFLDFIDLYIQCLTEKREEIGTRKNRLEIGVEKIASTDKEVGNLKLQLIELEPELEEKAKTLQIKKKEV